MPRTVNGTGHIELARGGLGPWWAATVKSVFDRGASLVLVGRAARAGRLRLAESRLPSRSRRRTSATEVLGDWAGRDAPGTLCTG